MGAPDPAAVLELPDAAAWDAWLSERGAEAAEAWLRIGKKGGREPLIGITDAGDVAICHGWIDSRRRSYDGESYLQRYSPRRAGSPWSLVNVRRAEALAAAGRMRPGGLREMDAARADGRRDAAYAPQREAEPPADFVASLDRAPSARSAFDGMGKTERYAILLPILKSPSAAARAERIEKAVSALGGA